MVKHIDTMYAFYLEVDTEVFPDTIQNLIYAAKQIEFLLVPKINNLNIKKRFRFSK